MKPAEQYTINQVRYYYKDTKLAIWEVLLRFAKDKEEWVEDAAIWCWDLKERVDRRGLRFRWEDALESSTRDWMGDRR